MQPRPRRPQLSAHTGSESSTNVTSAIGMEETVGHLRARRHSLFARTVLWITGLVCAALLLGTIAQAWSNSELNGRLQTEQQKLQLLRSANASLKRDVTHYNDPTVIEREARESLGYARPGERVVMVVPSGNTTHPQARSQPAQPKEQGFWQEWWSTFFGE